MNSGRKCLYATAILVAVVMTCVGYASAYAAKAPDTTLSDAELQSVRDNCIVLKNTLEQLNYSDTALRVNQGQYYEEISTKLMAPMNSRIALNKYDGGELTTITADYVKQIDTFRMNYTAYAKDLKQAQSDNCSADPQHFYDDIVTTEQARQTLHASVLKLNDMVKNYSQTFKDFAKTLPKSADGIVND